MPIPRVLEPEIMDSWDEAREYDSMDHSEVNRRFVQDLLAAGPCTGDILDLGTGTALIPIELCRHTHDSRVMAADAAVSMLDLARYNVEVSGMQRRVHLTQLDAKRLPQPDGTFDLVMSNSIIHHLPEPQICLAEAVRVTRLTGRLFFRDLMRPDTLETLEKLVETYAGSATPRQRTLFTESLHAALTLEEIRGLVAALGFPRDSVQATSDRHWTWAANRQG